MSTTATRILAEDLRSVAYTAIGAGYVAIGVPLLNPSVLLTITNDTNTGLIFSFNGVDDHLFISDGITGSYQFSANKVNDRGLFLANNTTIYVKESAAGAPGSGRVYVSSFYAYPGTGS